MKSLSANQGLIVFLFVHKSLSIDIYESIFMRVQNFLATLFCGILFSVYATQVISGVHANSGNPNFSTSKGLVSFSSTSNPKQTADRFEKLLLAKGFTIFKRIDHAQGAAKVGEQLNPTELIIFGNPKIGTKLMQCDQSAAIDLPQKALFWSDEDGKSWLSYNDPYYLAKRHLLKGCDDVIQKIDKGLGTLAKAATQDN